MTYIKLPVLVPRTKSGEPTKYVMGEAELVDDVLTINFKDSLPAKAIKRMLTRGENFALTFVMNPEDKEQPTS